MSLMFFLKTEVGVPFWHRHIPKLLQNQMVTLKMPFWDRKLWGEIIIEKKLFPKLFSYLSGILLFNPVGFQFSPKGIQANAQNPGRLDLVLAGCVVSPQYVVLFYALKGNNSAVCFQSCLPVL